MSRFWVVAIVLMAVASPARAASYYVGTLGNDSAAGTSRVAPWKTIQHAANTMVPGDVAVVLGGKYPERVYVSKSGTAAKPIAFEADLNSIVQMQGFEIRKGANYIQVVGFEITNTSHVAGDIEHAFGILWQGSSASSRTTTFMISAAKES